MATPEAAARAWARELPRDFVLRLAQALLDGPQALQALKTEVVLAPSKAAVQSAHAFAKQGAGPYLAGLLVGRLGANDEQQSVVPVWTGPESGATSGRLTLAVVSDLIGEARTEILLASYATIPGAGIRESLEAAVGRGVEVTLLLERPSDNPKFTGSNDPFPGLRARRLVWRASARPSGAAMHAKILVVDRIIALVGSANLTGYALERNLEAGLLVRGGPVPPLIVDHLLTADGLERV